MVELKADIDDRNAKPPPSRKLADAGVDLPVVCKVDAPPGLGDVTEEERDLNPGRRIPVAVGVVGIPVVGPDLSPLGLVRDGRVNDAGERTGDEAGL
ncbi:MAG: hypothetical protein KC431_20310, partial [Myxococcales bacterium]|nr:hypothetical protein [Myxococcales bacterium]